MYEFKINIRVYHDKLTSFKMLSLKQVYFVLCFYLKNVENLKNAIHVYDV